MPRHAHHGPHHSAEKSTMTCVARNGHARVRKPCTCRAAPRRTPRCAQHARAAAHAAMCTLCCYCCCTAPTWLLRLCGHMLRRAAQQQTHSCLLPERLRLVDVLLEVRRVLHGVHDHVWVGFGQLREQTLCDPEKLPNSIASPLPTLHTCSASCVPSSRPVPPLAQPPPPLALPPQRAPPPPPRRAPSPPRAPPRARRTRPQRASRSSRSSSRTWRWASGRRPGWPVVT